MTTILLAERGDLAALKVSRRRLHTRLLAATRASHLDFELACGANPDASAALSLRAQQLQTLASRRRVARGLRRVVAEAASAAHPFNRRRPLAREEIQAYRELIEELADLLEVGEPADPQGIAQARLLLCEGDSPLYRPRLTAALEPALQEAVDNLAVRRFALV